MAGKWDLMNITDVHHSPVTVRTSQSSTFLRRRSRLTETKIDQSMAAIDNVITSDDTITTTPTSAYSLKDRIGQSSMDYNTLDRTAMVSLMDDSGNLREVIQYPASTTIMDNTAFQLTMDNESTFGPNSRNVAIMGTSLDNSDPIKKACDELIYSFHNAVSDNPSSGEILSLLSTFSETCTGQIHQLKSLSKSKILTESISELSLERDTWLITEALYSDRLGGGIGIEEEGLVDMESINVQTDKMIEEKYFIQDRDVREAQLVVDWLERIAANSLEDFSLKVKYFADTVCWENTVHDIQQGLNKGHIVTEVDPDAPLRQNKNLSELDESDEQSLCKHLFKYIRAGQLEKAQELCVQCGQSWRAATMDGWKLHYDPNLHKGHGDDLEPIEGNCGHDLWKNCCWEMSNCSSYNIHERAMYAALCGNISQLLPTCQSWYDITWSYYRVMVDVLVEQRLRSSERYPPDRVPEELPKDYWNAQLVPDLIFQEIQANSSVSVRTQSTNIYHQVQKFLILGDLESLIDLLHSSLKKYTDSLHHLRFMAHIVLFVQTVGLEYDALKCQEITKKFAERLGHQSYQNLVALYISYLPKDIQVNCYSEMLAGVNGISKQKQCLKCAHEAGLQVASITKTVVENMRAKAMEELPADVHGIGSGQETEMSEADIEKIDVLDWLFYEEGQRAEAVHQANAMTRIFLAVRKHSVAQCVFNKIPNDSPAIIEKHWKMKEGDVPLSKNIENDLLEYCSIKAYLEAIESFNIWFQFFHSKKLVTPPVPPSSDDFTIRVGYERKLKKYEDESKQFKMQLNQLAQGAEYKIYNILLFVKGGWMVDMKECDEDENRKKQLSLLRQLCIPYLCLLLHTVFHNSKNYKKCLQLADTIASEKHKLYTLFRKDELRRFLGLLQSSSLELLDMPDIDIFGYNIV